MYNSPGMLSADAEGVALPAGAKELLAELAASHEAEIAAEVRKLETVHALCLAYGTLDEDAFGEAAEQLIYRGAQGAPPVAEYLSLEVAALLGVSPGSGATLIGQVLNCVYRHPLLWEAVRHGNVRWYRALDVIGEVNSARLGLDAALWVDQRIAPALASLPRGRANRVLRGLIALADPELARERELTARAHRHVTFWRESSDAGGCGDLSARLDLADASALDQTVNRLADVLSELGDTNPLDIRRATALGILADPGRAQGLLNDHSDPGSGSTTTVVLHLTDASLADAALVGRVEGHGPLSHETWSEMLGHGRVTIRPVVDLNGIAPVDAYEIPHRIRTAVTSRSPVDMFPFGTQPSRRLDLDHTVPYDHSRGRPPGQTRIDNLAPLTRRVHRAKTARRWRVLQDENGWLEWISPAGYRYAVGPLGTLPMRQLDLAS